MIEHSDPGSSFIVNSYLNTPMGLNLVPSPSVVALQDSKVPLSDVLPQELLVDILVERFQVGWLFSLLMLDKTLLN